MIDVDSVMSKDILNEFSNEKLEQIKFDYRMCLYDGIHDYLNINFYESHNKYASDILIRQIINRTINRNRTNIYNEFFEIIMLSIYDYNVKYIEELFIKNPIIKLKVEDDAIILVYENIKDFIISSKFINGYKNKSIFKSSVKTIQITHNYDYLKELIQSFINILIELSRQHIRKYMKLCIIGTKIDTYNILK